MIRTRTSRLGTIVPVLVLATALVLTVAGCGSKSANTGTTTTGTTATVKGTTAKTALTTAISKLATMAPDAKLLVVQTAAAVTSTTTPTWSYLFGSPKTDKTYLVYVAEGKTMPASEYGTANLSKAEWKLVPTADAWTVDSDAAYTTAMTAAKAKATAAYTMGFLTYVPAAESTSTTKPFVWYVSFDPASGAATGTVKVDAKTGSVVK